MIIFIIIMLHIFKTYIYIDNTKSMGLKLIHLYFYDKKSFLFKNDFINKLKTIFIKFKTSINNFNFKFFKIQFYSKRSFVLLPLMSLLIP